MDTYILDIEIGPQEAMTDIMRAVKNLHFGGISTPPKHVYEWFRAHEDWANSLFAGTLTFEEVNAMDITFYEVRLVRDDG